MLTMTMFFCIVTLLKALFGYAQDILLGENLDPALVVGSDDGA